MSAGQDQLDTEVDGLYAVANAVDRLTDELREWRAELRRQLEDLARAKEPPR